MTHLRRVPAVTTTLYAPEVVIARRGEDPYDAVRRYKRKRVGPPPTGGYLIIPAELVDPYRCARAWHVYGRRTGRRRTR